MFIGMPRIFEKGIILVRYTVSPQFPIQIKHNFNNAWITPHLFTSCTNGVGFRIITVVESTQFLYMLKNPYSLQDGFIKTL